MGPLEKSNAGHRYILVICEYATRSAEAFPLCSITTPKIIHTLDQLFSRVCLPGEILTEQGNNFMSRLMGQLNKQLGISAIRTTPATHRQTVLWRDSTRLRRIFYGSLLQKQDVTGTSGHRLSLSFSLLTEKSLKLQQVSYHSSFNMGGTCKDHWTCRGTAGRRVLQPSSRRRTLYTLLYR